MSTENEITATIEGFETEAPQGAKAQTPMGDIPTKKRKPATRPPVTEEEAKYMPYASGTFKIGELVCYSTRTPEPGEPGSFGMVVYYQGKEHIPERPRVRWANGLGVTERASDLRLIGNPAFAAMFPKVQLSVCDFLQTERQSEAEAERKASEAERQAVENATPWPDAARKNREAWLSEAARRVVSDPSELAPVLFSVGYGKGGTRGSTNWAVVANAGDKVGFQVFVKPTVHDKVAALAALFGALASLGIRIVSKAEMDGRGKDWPDYPQPEAQTEHKSQTTRLLKCQCTVCGCTFRMTQRWIPEGGTMQCPRPVCNSLAVAVP